MGPAAFLFNPSSGRGKSLHRRARIESALKKQGIGYRWFTSKSEKHLKKIARSAGRDFPIVVAVGGDTTFLLVASELISVNSRAAMGMLGTGSANDIARSLGIDDIAALCRALRSGNSRWMDVGALAVEGKEKSILFLGALSLGIGAEVNRFMIDFWNRHPLLKRGGDLFQTLGGIIGIRDSFRRKRVPQRIRLRTDGFDEWLDFSLMVFSNIPCYAGGLKLTPEMTPFNGRLDCCVVQTENWGQTMAVAWRARKGLHSKDHRVRLLSGNSFELSSESPLDLQYDGDLCSSVRKFRISVLPAALKILA